jgi:hypothetical protein
MFLVLFRPKFGPENTSYNPHDLIEILKTVLKQFP